MPSFFYMSLTLPGHGVCDPDHQKVEHHPDDLFLHNSHEQVTVNEPRVP